MPWCHHVHFMTLRGHLLQANKVNAWEKILIYEEKTHNFQTNFDLLYVCNSAHHRFNPQNCVYVVQTIPSCCVPPFFSRGSLFSYVYMCIHLLLAHSPPNARNNESLIPVYYSARRVGLKG